MVTQKTLDLGVLFSYMYYSHVTKYLLRVHEVDRKGKCKLKYKKGHIASKGHLSMGHGGH